MRTYIFEFKFGEAKFQQRLRAAGFGAAYSAAVSMVDALGGSLVSLIECPVQRGEL